MKKSVKNMIEVFAKDPMQAEAVFDKKSARWNRDDIHLFWSHVIATHPDDERKKAVTDAVSFLFDNDLIPFEDIACDFVDFYGDYGNSTNVGLTEFVYDYISANIESWLEECDLNEADDLLMAYVEATEKCWYGSWLVYYCVYYSDTEDVVLEVARAMRY